MTNVEEVARAKCLSQQGIWGGAWSDAWSPETLASADAIKCPAHHITVEGFAENTRFKYFVPHRFVSKGGHDVPIISPENYRGAA